MLSTHALSEVSDLFLQFGSDSAQCGFSFRCCPAVHGLCMLLIYFKPAAPSARSRQYPDSVWGHRYPADCPGYKLALEALAPQLSQD